MLLVENLEQMTEWELWQRFLMSLIHWSRISRVKKAPEKPLDMMNYYYIDNIIYHSQWELNPQSWNCNTWNTIWFQKITRARNLTWSDEISIIPKSQREKKPYIISASTYCETLSKFPWNWLNIRTNLYNKNVWNFVIVLFDHFTFPFLTI